MSLSVRQILAAGRAIVVEKEPYLAHAIMSLVPREKPGMCVGRGWGVRSVRAPFAVTEGLVMFYDPQVIEYWMQTSNNIADVAEWVAFCIAHEVGHPLREHAQRQRAGGYHPTKYNRAADLEINDDLQAAGYKVPPCGALFPEEVIKNGKSGLTAEEYYHQDTWEPGDNEDGMCGGGSGAGDRHDDEDDEDEAARSPSDAEQIRRQTAAAVREHAEKGRGEVPGGWQRWAEQKLKPSVIPWESKLRATIGNAIEFTRGMVMRTYAKPYRRQAALGYGPDSPILPGWHAPKPEIAIVIDTSGSMGTDELTRAVSETAAILENMDCGVTLMTNDADVQGPVKRINSVDEIDLNGGGGTDFRPPFEFIVDRMDEPKPGIIVFITDGVGPAHRDNPCPHIQTVWVLVGPYRQRPWGAAPEDDGWSPGQPIGWGEFVEVHDQESTSDGYYSDDEDEDEDEDA